MSREKMLRARERKSLPLVPAHIMDAIRRRHEEQLASLERWAAYLATHRLETPHDRGSVV